MSAYKVIHVRTGPAVILRKPEAPRPFGVRVQVPGMQGPRGVGTGDEFPDLTLLFENGLI